MRKTAKTILCCGIAMVLLLLGMNGKEAETDFYAKNSENQKITLDAEKESMYLLETGLLETKIQAVRDTFSIQQMVSGSISGRKELNVYFFSLIAPGLSDNTSETDRIDVLIPSKIRHREALLGYIHDLDGKKRV